MKRRFILIIIIICWVSFWFYRYNQNIQNLKSYEFTGTIDSVRKIEKGFSEIVVNGKQYLLTFSIHPPLEKGDSIIKSKGTEKMILVKKNKMKYLLPQNE